MSKGINVCTHCGKIEEREEEGDLRFHFCSDCDPSKRDPHLIFSEHILD